MDTFKERNGEVIAQGSFNEHKARKKIILEIVSGILILFSLFCTFMLSLVFVGFLNEHLVLNILSSFSFLFFGEIKGREEINVSSTSFLVERLILYSTLICTALGIKIYYIDEKLIDEWY